MKKLLLLVLLSTIPIYTFSQLVRGRVLDHETKKPVDYASVYINGTFLGTSTNANGEFVLDVTSQPKRAIQISAVGYRSTSLNAAIEGKYYELRLKKAMYEIQEVAIESKSLTKERERCMKTFKDEFLGRSRNAKDCRIMNEEVITFNYHTNHDTLKAVAREPLVILNTALGYQLTYYLDKFELDKVHKTTSFSGNIIFNMDLVAEGQSRKEYAGRRKKTYNGSCSHFFSALWLNKLSKEGFRLQEVEGIVPLDYTDFVHIDTKGSKYFTYPRNLEIAYDYHLTTVSFRAPIVYFARDGFFEPEAIVWYGYMSMARIADWLPYEYSPD